MPDNPVTEYDRIVIEGPDGVDANITTQGNTPTDLLRVGGGVYSLGQKTMAASAPVVLASDQTSIPVTATISAIPPIPQGATAIDSETFGNVASTSGIDTYVVITNLKTLTIQTFIGGAEEKTGGSVCELFFDVNGNLSVLTRIRTIWVNGDSFTVGVDQSFVGDGTARMVLRRRGYTGSGREMEVAFSGYEETT